MNTILRLFLLLGIIIYYIILFGLLKKKRLNLKYSLLWIFSGVLMLVVVIFPGILSGISNLFGIAVPTNTLFAILSFFILVILMSLTAIVSGLNNKLRQLIQHIAMIEKRVRELEEKIAEYDKNQ